MDRRSAIVASLLAVSLAEHRPAGAEAPAPLRRIGILGTSNAVAGKVYLDTFAAELAKLGWLEGKNLATTYLGADGDPTRFPALAAQLVALKPDVIMATTPGTSLALQRATKSIPVLITANDPVADGLVQSLAHPGGNLTGIAIGSGYDIQGKRLELLKDWLPKLSRVAVLYQPTDPSDIQSLESIRRYAGRIGVQIEPLGIRNPAEIEPAMVELAQRRPDAAYLFGAGANYTHREAICARLLALGLPSTTGGTTSFADAGCLMSYTFPLGPSLRALAWYVDRILRGAKPADLPVQEPMQYELVINARTAKALGLNIPPILRLRADRVIE